MEKFRLAKVQVERPESRHERVDRIARELLHAERTARDKKTARLREMRLKTERMTSS